VLKNPTAFAKFSHDLASYTDSYWVGRKRAWLLFVHVCNYLLLNMCSSNSGRRTRNMHSQEFSKYITVQQRVKQLCFTVAACY